MIHKTSMHVNELHSYRFSEACSAKPVKIDEKLFIDGFLKLKLF